VNHAHICSSAPIASKEDHQADLTEYSFWKHHFNKEWHLKKYTKIQEIQKESICSVVNSKKI